MASEPEQMVLELTNTLRKVNHLLKSVHNHNKVLDTQNKNLSQERDTLKHRIRELERKAAPSLKRPRPISHAETNKRGDARTTERIFPHDFLSALKLVTTQSTADVDKVAAKLLADCDETKKRTIKIQAANDEFIASVSRCTSISAVERVAQLAVYLDAGLPNLCVLDVALHRIMIEVVQRHQRSKHVHTQGSIELLVTFFCMCCKATKQFQRIRVMCLDILSCWTDTDIILVNAMAKHAPQCLVGQGLVPDVVLRVIAECTIRTQSKFPSSNIRTGELISHRLLGEHATQIQNTLQLAQRGVLIVSPSQGPQQFQKIATPPFAEWATGVVAYLASNTATIDHFDVLLVTRLLTEHLPWSWTDAHVSRTLVLSIAGTSTPARPQLTLDVLILLYQRALMLGGPKVQLSYATLPQIAPVCGTPKLVEDLRHLFDEWLLAIEGGEAATENSTSCDLDDANEPDKRAKSESYSRSKSGDESNDSSDDWEVSLNENSDKPGDLAHMQHQLRMLSGVD